MLKSLFYWLDSHPASYWVGAGVPTLLLLGWLVLSAWREHRTPEFRPRVTWREGLALFLFLLAWRWPFFLVASEFNPDESQLIAGARTLAHDPVFWRSVDGTTSGPINFYLLLPIHWLGLPLDYFFARFAGLLFVAAGLFACLRALAHKHGHTAAWLGILPAAVFFATVTHSDLVHYSSEHPSLLLIALPAWLLATRSPDERVRLWTGLFVAGSTPWAKLQTAPLALVLIAWAAWQVLNLPNAPWRHRLRELALGALAALTPTLLIFTMTAATGQLEHVFRRYFVHNLLYVQANDQTLAKAMQGMFTMASGDGRLVLLVGTVLIALLAAAGYLAFKRVRPSALLVFSALLSVAAVLAALVPRREFLHYGLLLPVPFTLLLGAAVGAWWEQLASRRVRLAFAWGLIALFALPPIITRFRQPPPSIYGSFSYQWAHPLSPVSMIVKAFTGPTGSVGVWGWANFIYVETGLIQATRDPHSVWDIIDTPQRDYHRALYLDDLRRSQPAVFVDAVGKGSFCFERREGQAHEIFPALAEYIRTNYLLVRDFESARIYVRKDVAARVDLSPLQIDQLVARGRSDRVDTSPPPLTPPAQLNRKPLGSRTVTMLLPPTVLEWKLDADVRAVAVEFGFDPEAWERGTTNGAEISVELVTYTNTRLVYRRLLDPRRRPEDRGPQTANIILPPFGPGARLVLRTGPGEFGDNAWDWVYLANLQFRRSPRYLPEQFPGFSRVPDEAEAEMSFLAPPGPDPAIQLNAPAVLTFVLAGGERRLQLQYGLRSGAYTNGGQTDGANFRVEMQEPHQSPRVLFARLLDPGHHAEDRGTQVLDLALPAVARDSRLVISIDPGPAGNGAWDWTYLTDLTLK